METCFNSLTLQVLVRGYCPKPYKSVLIVHPDNLEAGNYFWARYGFKVYTGADYLGVYIRYKDSKSDWLRENMLMWEDNINTISKTAGKYPQVSYAAVVSEIQSEWIFLQRVTWYTGGAFAGV